MNDISYRQGLRSKGFQITVPPAGASQTLTLSGLARSFEGILLSSTTAAAPGVLVDPLQLRVTLIVNNDVVIDEDVAYHYSGVTTGWPHFLPIPRRLTGQDTILLKVSNGTGANQILNCSIWYKNSI